MAWRSNISQLNSDLEAWKESIDSKVEAAANKALVIGLNNVQNICPVDTGNLKNSYPRCSKVEKVGDGHYKVTWTSDVSYQIYVEPKRPHLSPGIHAAMPEIVEDFKKALEE